MHRETSFPLVVVFITFRCSCHHSLTQTHRNISVTSAAREKVIFSDERLVNNWRLRYCECFLLQADSTRLYLVTSRCLAVLPQTFLNTSQHNCSYVALQLSGLFPRISPPPLRIQVSLLLLNTVDTLQRCVHPFHHLIMGMSLWKMYTE